MNKPELTVTLTPNFNYKLGARQTAVLQCLQNTTMPISYREILALHFTTYKQMLPISNLRVALTGLRANGFVTVDNAENVTNVYKDD
jgi:Fe2+ or Zn2+ uptake regulation protein